MVGRRQIIFKLSWLKCPKIWNLDQKIMKNLIFGYFLLISDFLVKPQSQQKLAKKSFILQNSFAPKTSFILWTQHYKTYSCNTSKTMLLFGVRENFSIAPFLGAQEMHFRSTCKSDTWGKGFNSGLSKFCGRQPLRDMVSLSRAYLLKGCLPPNLLSLICILL